MKKPFPPAKDASTQNSRGMPGAKRMVSLGEPDMCWITAISNESLGRLLRTEKFYTPAVRKLTLTRENVMAAVAMSILDLPYLIVEHSGHAGFQNKKKDVDAGRYWFLLGELLTLAKRAKATEVRPLLSKSDEERVCLLVALLEEVGPDYTQMVVDLLGVGKDLLLSQIGEDPELKEEIIFQKKGKTRPSREAKKLARLTYLVWKFIWDGDHGLLYRTRTSPFTAGDFMEWLITEFEPMNGLRPAHVYDCFNLALELVHEEPLPQKRIRR